MSSDYIVATGYFGSIVPMVTGRSLEKVGSAYVDNAGKTLLLMFAPEYRSIAEHHSDYSYRYVDSPKPHVMLSPIPGKSASKLRTGLRFRLRSLKAVQAGWAFGVPEDGRDEWLDQVISGVMEELDD